MRSVASTGVLIAAVMSAPHSMAQDATAYVDKASGPNYHWTEDLQSQIMAGRAGAILHRVAGSWFNAPDIPQESKDAQARGKSLYGPGTPLFVGPSTLCTLAVAGIDGQGRMVGITAGHCGGVGDAVASADSWEVGVSGTVVKVNPQLDYAVIEFGSNAEVTRSYNGVTINALGGPIGNQQTLCKQGVASGWTCGPSWQTGSVYNTSQVCAMQGDSGSPLLIGDRFVGLISGGTLPVPEWSCRTPLQGSAHSPTSGPIADVILADLNASGGVGAGFHLS